MAAWVALTEERRRAEADKVAHLAPPAGGKQPKDKGIRKAARDLGMKRDAVARHLAVASLSPQAKARKFGRLLLALQISAGRRVHDHNSEAGRGLLSLCFKVTGKTIKEASKQRVTASKIQ